MEKTPGIASQPEEEQVIDSKPQSTEAKASVHHDSEFLLLIHVLPIIPSSARSFFPGIAAGLLLTRRLNVLVSSLTGIHQNLSITASLGNVTPSKGLKAEIKACFERSTAAALFLTFRRRVWSAAGSVLDSSPRGGLRNVGSVEKTDIPSDLIQV